ncbi:hypothetical protein RchiOBHm_Chr4g0394791 [Rosa chinensis]|uniref:Uncharacterized protein n=1 Tax=Rosa chinensis TaxID=74649 RepID=A0A2P6QRC0_ROSCH|nr:uncharacterized protein LOC112200705 [Rosa chinensis]PRQ36726.1 hypothetical protein RchiOBHm_Chr4g0394791 [Rosa chinensis]
METDEKEKVQNGGENESLSGGGGTGESEKVEEQGNGDEDSESNSLLPPRKGGMSRKTNKTRRKVQWNDRNGNKLVEVLEYEPSDVSDSDDEDADSCICVIM